MEKFMEVVKYFNALLPQVLDGTKNTLEIFIITLMISIPLGVCVALGKRSKIKIINKCTSFYILIMRGTPLLLQIVFIFFGLPTVGIIFDRFTAAIIAFVLNYSAYFGEIFRAGIDSIDQGQYNAASVLGLSKKDTFLRIILPQAFKRVLPPVANEIVTLIKDTALVYVIGLDELLKVGKIACNRDSSLMPLLLVGLVYLFLILIITKIMDALEKKYSYYR